MKRLALVAAVLAIAACSKSEQTADTSKPAMAPAPAAAMDTAMKKMDSGMAKMDTGMKMMDTAKKAAAKEKKSTKGKKKGE